jgi:hypothetical protein
LSVATSEEQIFLLEHSKIICGGIVAAARQEICRRGRSEERLRVRFDEAGTEEEETGANR